MFLQNLKVRNDDKIQRIAIFVDNMLDNTRFCSTPFG